MLLGATWGGAQFPLHLPLAGLPCSEHTPASSADILSISHESRLGQVQGITQQSASSGVGVQAVGAEQAASKEHPGLVRQAGDQNS